MGKAVPYTRQCGERVEREDSNVRVLQLVDLGLASLPSVLAKLGSHHRSERVCLGALLVEGGGREWAVRRRASESRQRQGKRNRGSGAAAVGMMNGYEIKHVLTYVAGQVHDRPEAVPVQLQARSRRPVHGERLLPN